MPPKRRGLTKTVRMSEPLTVVQSRSEELAALSQAAKPPPEPPPLASAPSAPSVQVPAPETSGEAPSATIMSRKAVLELVIQNVQIQGFTHPYDDSPGYTMIPPEFEAILSVENKAVSQVIFRIFRATIGQADTTHPKDKHGRYPRREWAIIPHDTFGAICGMTPSQVNRGIKGALQKGYILRRREPQGFAYAVRWKTIDKKLSE